MADSMTTTTTNGKPEDDVLVLDEETVQLLHIIMEQEPLNKVCSECPQRSPGFVAFLAPPAVLVSDLEALGWHQRLGMGVFCCAGCMGYHMQVGNPVRKLKEGEILTKTEFLALEQTGNRVVNEIWEATMDGYDKDIEEEHEEEERKAYVVMKYQQLKYFDENAYKQHMAGRKEGGVPASEEAKPESNHQTLHTAQDSQSNVSLTEGDVSLADLGYGEEQECGNGMIAQNNTSASNLSVPGEERGREIEQYQTPLRRRRNLSVTGDKRGSLGDKRGSLGDKRGSLGDKRGSLGEKRTSMGSGRQTPASTGQDRRKRFNMAGRQLSMPSLNLAAAESKPQRGVSRIQSGGVRSLKQARGNRRASVDHSPQPPSAEERTRRKERRSGSLGVENNLQPENIAEPIRKPRKVRSIGQLNMLDQPEEPNERPKGRGLRKQRQSSCRNLKLAGGLESWTEHSVRQGRRGLMGRQKSAHNLGQISRERSKSKSRPQVPRQSSDGSLGYEQAIEDLKRGLPLSNGDPNGVDVVAQSPKRQGRRGMSRQKSATGLGEGTKPKSRSPKRSSMARPVRQSSLRSLSLEQYDPSMAAPKRGVSRKQSRRDLSVDQIENAMEDIVRRNRSASKSLSLADVDPSKVAPKRGVSRKQSRRSITLDDAECDDPSRIAPKRSGSRKQSRRSITLDADAECEDAEEARALAARSRPSSRDVRGKETSARKESSRRSSKRTSLDELHNQHTSSSQPVEVQSLASKELEEKRRRQAQSLRGGKRSSLAEQRSHSSRHVGRSSSSRDLGNEDRSKDKEGERRSSGRRESSDGRSRSKKKEGGSASDDRKSSRKSRRESDETRSSDNKKSSSSKSPKPSSSHSSSSKKDDKDKDTRPSRKEMIKEAKRNSSRRLDCQDEVDPLEARMAMLKDAQRRASVAAS